MVDFKIDFIEKIIFLGENAFHFNFISHFIISLKSIIPFSIKSFKILLFDGQGY
jgi:hypothetical protein